MLPAGFRILLLTPPMVDTHTPYAATPFLTGFLRERGFDAHQADLSLELFLRLFSREGLQQVHAVARDKFARGALTDSPPLTWFFDRVDGYLATIDPVVAFLQGRDPTLAARLATRRFVPEGPRFESLSDRPVFRRAVSEHGEQDRAKFVATLYVQDLADLIRTAVDPHFDLISYGGQLASSQPSFDPLYARLTGERTLIDDLLADMVRPLLDRHQPALVGLTAPFPGNVYGALRIGGIVKSHAPSARVVLGGGFVNTELRSLSDPRVFDFVDYITVDDGERPLECLIEHVQGRRPESGLLRTMVRRPHAGRPRVVTISAPEEHDVPVAARGTPTYRGLDLDRYVSLLDSPNPMERVWHEFHWNKLMLAHGCYWRKCSFCDVSLNYIRDYQPDDAGRIVDRIDAMVRETGRTGFYFVDEAAPPALLRGISQELIARNLAVSWWGNVRFEKAFGPSLVALMARAGCIAVTGGLEVASDRLLKLMNKGVTVAQVAQVTRAFRDAGIYVHAYLIYGFASETLQETIDQPRGRPPAVRRRLPDVGLLAPLRGHRAQPHRPEPGRVRHQAGARSRARRIDTDAEIPVFAVNTLRHEDPAGCPNAHLGAGLRKAVHHYMLGTQLDRPVESWFEIEVPATTVARNLIEASLVRGRHDLDHEAETSR